MLSVLIVGSAVGCVYALVALGYALVYRTTGIVNFAQGCFVMLGGMVTWWLMTRFSLSYPLSIAGGVAAAAAAGLLMYGVLILPLWKRNAPPFSVLLGTVTFSALVGNLAAFTISTEPQTLPPWFAQFRLTVGADRIEGQYLVLLALMLPLFAGVSFVIWRTQLGRAMRACSANRNTSELLGISPQRVALITIVATGALGGIGGAVVAPAQFTSAIEAPFTYGIFGFIAAILGGLGTFRGALVGGVVVGIVQVAVNRYLALSYYNPAVLYAILLLLLMLMPKGIFGDSVEGRVV